MKLPLINRLSDLKLLYRLSVLSLLILTPLATYRLVGKAENLAAILASRRQLGVLSLGGLAFAFDLLLLGILLKKAPAGLISIIDRVLEFFQKNRLITLAGFGLFVALVTYLVYGIFGDPYEDNLLRFSTFAHLGLISYLAFSLLLPIRKPVELFWASILLSACSFKVGSYIPDLSTLPFTLDWSEASRYYYASLFFARRIYQLSLPPITMSPTRYLLQAIPFLIPNLPIWVHRLWQVLLSVGTTLAVSVFLAKRLKLTDPFYHWLFVGFSFLFIMIGPVYYFLLVPVIPIIAVYNSAVFKWKQEVLFLFVLMISSAWVAISRPNWYPMPALLAITFYVVEQPYAPRRWLEYFARPILYLGVDFATVVIALKAYTHWAGTVSHSSQSGNRYLLLWDRLLPNPTYSSGILIAIAWVILPMFFLCLVIGYQKRIRVGFWRLSCLLGILASLFGVGLIVSAKIGGGSNLHNLDTFLIMMLIVTSYLYFNRVTWEKDISIDIGIVSSSESQLIKLTRWVNGLAVCLVFIPLLKFNIFGGGPIYTPPPSMVNEAIRQIRTISQYVSADQKKILFINERQLLTFGYIPGVKLVPEYEKLVLVEMAIEGNETYLTKFKKDLATHRYGAIIFTQVILTTQNDVGRYGEENRAWRKYVNKPLFCYYQPVATYQKLHLQVLVPRNHVSKKCH